MGFFSDFMKNVRIRMVSFLGYQTRSAPFDKEAWYHDTFRATVDAIASHGSKGQFQAVIINKEGRIEKVISSGIYQMEWDKARSHISGGLYQL